MIRRLCVISIILVFGVILCTFRQRDPQSGTYSNNAPSTSSKPSEDELECELPELARLALDAGHGAARLSTWNDARIGVTFNYPSDWSVKRDDNVLYIVPPSTTKNLPYKGDSDAFYAIYLSTSTDVNQLGNLSNGTRSSTLKISERLPVKEFWLTDAVNPVRVYYCIYNYSEGATALIYLRDSTIRLAITRFADGITPEEDWRALFQIARSLKQI